MPRPNIIFGGTRSHTFKSVYGYTSPLKVFTISATGLESEPEISTKIENGSQEILEYSTDALSYEENITVPGILYTGDDGDVSYIIPQNTIYARTKYNAPVGVYAKSGTSQKYQIAVSASNAARSGMIDVTGIITGKELYISGISIFPKIYNGKFDGELVYANNAPKYSGLISGEEYFNVVGEGIVKFYNSSAGIRLALISGYERPSENYILIDPVITGLITGKPINLLHFGVVDKTYDRTRFAVLTGLINSGLLYTGDRGLVEVGNSFGEFSTEIPGLHAVTGRFFLEGVKADNYILQQPQDIGNNLFLGQGNIFKGIQDVIMGPFQNININDSPKKLPTGSTVGLPIDEFIISNTNIGKIIEKQTQSFNGQIYIQKYLQVIGRGSATITAKVLETQLYSGVEVTVPINGIELRLGPCCCDPGLDIMILMENNFAMDYRPPRWGNQNSSVTTLSKGLIGSDLINDIVRNIKKTNLEVNDTTKIWFYKNNNWEPGFLSRMTTGSGINTFSVVHWPLYKSPPQDMDPVGIKQGGELAAENNEPYSFTAVLSEGRGENIYNIAGGAGFIGYPNSRKNDKSLAFVKGHNFSTFTPGGNYSPPDGALTKGSYYSIFLDGLFRDLSNSDPNQRDLRDTIKIYKSSTSGYLVDTKRFFDNTGVWPLDYGTVTEHDLLTEIPSAVGPPSTQGIWNWEYYPRIPEFEKTKIKWRDVRIGFADFNDYNNRYPREDVNSICISYSRSSEEVLDKLAEFGIYPEEDNFNLCFPACETDTVGGCPAGTYLRAAEGAVDDIDTDNFYGIKTVSLNPSRKGLYMCRPAVELVPIKGSGVGGILKQVITQTPPEAGPTSPVNLVTCGGATTITSKGFGYIEKPIISYQRVLDTNAIFIEDFTSLGGGSNTNHLSDFPPWSGNDNIVTYQNSFEAGGAVLLSGGDAFINTRELELDLPLGGFGLIVNVKGWTGIEGQLEIKLSGTSDQPILVNYSNTIEEGFETKFFDIPPTTGRSITFRPTQGRLLIDEIRVYIPGNSAAGYERGWVLKSDFTRNFDNVYAASPYERGLSLDQSQLNNSSTRIVVERDHGSLSAANQNFINAGVYTTQGLSAIRNACYKFSPNAKKMILFVSNGFLAHNGTIHDEAEILVGNPDFPYPSVPEIKYLLNIKKVILHAITFNSSYRPPGYDPTLDYQELAHSLKAFAPLVGPFKEDNNTKSGYISTIEAITSIGGGPGRGYIELSGTATGSRLWVLNTTDLENSIRDIARDRTCTIDGELRTRFGGRLCHEPSSLRRTKLGILYSIKKILGENVRIERKA